MPTFRSSMFCKSSAPNQRGFLLIEIIVGVGLLALLGYMAMEWVTVTARNTARDAAIAETVADYKVLVRAATEYVAEQQGSWSPGSSHTITIATLEAAGKLPAGFATRAYGAGRTVFGAPFRIVSIRNALEPGSKTVIGDAPTDNQAAFEALGWNYTAAQALATKRAVAAALAAEGLPVATTPAGSSTATGGGSNQWTKPLAAWIGTPTWPGLHVLMGWPDLAGSLVDDGDTSTFSGNCSVVSGRNNGYTYSAPRCPSGYTEYDRWRACSSSGMSFRTTPVGASLSFAQESVSNSGGLCNSACLNSHPEMFSCDGLKTYVSNEVYVLNGVRTEATRCSHISDTNDYNLYGPTNGCGLGQLATPTSEELAAQQGLHHESILCCISN